MTVTKVLALGVFLFGQWLPLNILVDKSHGLPSDYDPGLHPEAEAAVEELMFYAGNVEGFEASKLMEVSSGYRSYEEQEWYVRLDPSNRAPAGHSEHQLGTAFDMSGPGYVSWWDNPTNRAVWTWLEWNAHKFGFVISYPYKECEEWPHNNKYVPACGVEYMHEPWHIRYVGKELAETMYNDGYLDPTSDVVPQDYYEPIK